MKSFHEVEKRILVKLIHNPCSSYNSLWNKEEDSSKFAYHLKKLVDDNLVINRNGKYYLSDEGITYASGADNDNAERVYRPVIAAFALCINEGKILLWKRNREPYHGFLVMPGGRVDFGSTPLETVRKYFKNKTGCDADFKLVGVGNFTTSKESVIHHVIGFIYEASNLEGKITNCKWVKLDNLDKVKTFPETKELLDQLIKNKNNVKFFSVNRIFEKRKLLYSMTNSL